MKPFTFYLLLLFSFGTSTLLWAESDSIIFGAQSAPFTEFRFLHVQNQNTIIQSGIPLSIWVQFHPRFTIEGLISYQIPLGNPFSTYKGEIPMLGGIRFYPSLDSFVIPYAFARTGPTIVRDHDLHLFWEGQVGGGFEFRVDQYPIVHLQFGLVGQLPVYAPFDSPLSSTPRIGAQVSLQIPAIAVLYLGGCALLRHCPSVHRASF